MSKTRFVQLGIPNAEYDGYIFDPVAINELLSEIESTAEVVRAEAVEEVKKHVKQSIQKRKQKKGQAGT